MRDLDLDEVVAAAYEVAPCDVDDHLRERFAEEWEIIDVRDRGDHYLVLIRERETSEMYEVRAEKPDDSPPSISLTFSS